MRLTEPYSVPALNRMAPEVRSATSCIMPYPCWSRSASATRIWKTCGVKGNRPAAAASGEDVIFWIIPCDDIVSSDIVATLPLAVYFGCLVAVMEAQPSSDQRIYSEDGVDLTMIRWMLSLTPAERLEVLQSAVTSILDIRERNGAA